MTNNSTYEGFNVTSLVEGPDPGIIGEIKRHLELYGYHKFSTEHSWKMLCGSTLRIIGFRDSWFLVKVVGGHIYHTKLVNLMILMENPVNFLNCVLLFAWLGLSEPDENDWCKVLTGNNEIKEKLNLEIMEVNNRFYYMRRVKIDNEIREMDELELFELFMDRCRENKISCDAFVTELVFKYFA